MKEQQKNFTKITVFVLLISLIFFSLLPRLLLPINSPFFGDEALYAQELDELINSKSIYTTYLGNYVPWKPPLTFYVYALIFNILNPLGLSIEVTYRIPSLLFGFLSVVVFFFFTLEISKDKERAFVSSLIFSTIPALFVTNAMLMTDNLLIFLILSALYFYIKGEKNEKLFLIGAVFTFFAFLTKTVVSLMLPLLSIAYFYFKNKKMLKNKFFLVSLLAIPLAFLLMSTIFGGEFNQQYIVDLSRITLSFTDVKLFVSNVALFLIMLLPWLPFSISGIIATLNNKKKKKMGYEEKFLFFWLLFLIPPFFAGSLLWWYFIPILPSLSIFAADGVSKKKIDKAVILFVLIISLIATFFSYGIVLSFTEDKPRFAQKETGLFLSGKENILLFTYYSPGIIYYKFHNEKSPSYDSLDIIFTEESAKDLKDLDKKLLTDLLIYSMPPQNSTDYLKALYGVSFSEPFVVYGRFDRHPDYIVIDKVMPFYVEIENILKEGGYKVIFTNFRYEVFERSEK